MKTIKLGVALCAALVVPTSFVPVISEDAHAALVVGGEGWRGSSSVPGALCKYGSTGLYGFLRSNIASPSVTGANTTSRRGDRTPPATQSGSTIRTQVPTTRFQIGAPGSSYKRECGEPGAVSLSSPGTGMRTTVCRYGLNGGAAADVSAGVRTE